MRALEASERKLRRFVADASHELRTPLAAVRAYAELFARGADTRPDDLERSMKGISRESERMSVLVDDLLLLARLDEGRPLEREPVELDERRRRGGRDGADARAGAPDRARAPSRWSCPATATASARSSTTSSRTSARTRRPGAPVAGRRCRERNGARACSRSPTPGPGWTPSRLAHVFERFYRADPSRARASGGAGLGLAIVAAVVEAHGGTASASSQPGAGTTFRITLPLSR